MHNLLWEYPSKADCAASIVLERREQDVADGQPARCASLGGMSNLVPTPRVDKNGRLTIRHMKPEAATASASLSASAPSLGTVGKRQMSDKEFLAYLAPEREDFQHEMYQDALYGITEHSPDVIEDVVSLLELGNEAGSRSVREFFVENLDTVAYQMTQGKDVSSRVDGFENRTDTLKEALVVHWSVGALSSEARECFFYSTQSGVSQTLQVHRSIKSASGTEAHANDLSYWRAVGATALLVGVLSGDDLSAGEVRERRELVQWMKTKEYLGDIIRVGVERGLKDVESIKTVLESDVPPSLSSGAL